MVETLRREKPAVATIEPAQGEDRRVFLAECSALLREKGFDADSWRQFTSNMVSLLGGEEDKKRSITTSWLIDRE